MARKTAWLTLQRPTYVLDDSMLKIWGSLPQNTHAFERACYVCMTAVLPEEGSGQNALTGHELAKDMPISGEDSQQQAKAMARWIERLLDQPSHWPGSAVTYGRPWGRGTREEVLTLECQTG